MWGLNLKDWLKEAKNNNYSGILDIGYKKLHHFPKSLNPYLNNIERVWCRGNKFIKLPKMNNLKKLDCSYNNLSKLPNFPNLIELQCSDNNLTELPNFPNLIELICFDNCITELPNFPNLIELYCSHNYLTGLPNLPSLIVLNCSNNKLTELPNFPNLKVLIVDEEVNIDNIYINLYKVKIKHKSISIWKFAPYTNEYYLTEQIVNDEIIRINNEVELSIYKIYIKEFSNIFNLIKK